MRDEETLFAEVVAAGSPFERSAALERGCGHDPDLRRRVEALLAAHDKAAGILDVTAPGLLCNSDSGTRTPAPLGSSVGPYKLLELIGEGGMGAVYMAEQQRPVRRTVALKLIKPGMDTKQAIARFEAERQALAMMDHPNIAKVLDAGSTDGGRLYFVMELVKGVPVTDYCDQNKLTPRQRLELFVQVCHAVQHAHQKGVIHRDLKPTNVLVTLHDGRPVPKIIDFGIAKATGGNRLTELTLYTNFNQMVGTPLYMSPEQAELSGLDVDTRSDVYSLGVLLYELLTGTTPFDKARLGKAAYDEIRRIIRDEEPPRPSTRISTLGGTLAAVSSSRGTEPKKLGQLVRGELDWIVMKALEKERVRRYETAAAFAADVRRYLGNEAVLACPPTPLYRFRKFARRNKRALASVAVLTVAALVGVSALAASTVLVWRANKGLSESVARETRAADRERREAYFQRITVAHRELLIDNLAAALEALEQCPQDLRAWEWNYLMRLCRVDPLVIRDNTAVYGVGFSSDGNLIASAGEDGSIKVRDSRTGQVVGVVPKAHADAVLSVAFHRDGKRLASRGADQMLRVWDWTTGRKVFEQPCDAVRWFGSSGTVAFSPDGTQLAAGIDGTVTVWDWKEHRRLHSFPGHGKNTINLAYSRDGRRLASACTGEGLKLWDPRADGPPLRTLPGQRNPLTGLAFGPDGGWLASASLDHSLKLWDMTTGALLTHPMVHTGTIESVAVSPDGRRLASVGEDKIVRLWDPTNGREVLSLRGHTDRCGSVAFSPDEHGWRLASGSIDGTIRIWDATPLRPDERQEALTFAAHGDDEVRTVVVNPKFGKVASAGQGSLVRVWDPATGETSINLDCRTNVVFSAAWDRDGERIAAAGWDGQFHGAQVRDARSGAERFMIRPGPENPDEAYYAVAFSPDGRHLVTGGSGAVQVWDAQTGKPVGVLGKHNREVRALVFSRDGKHLASASSDGEVKLWDATRLTEEPEARPPLRARVPGPTLNVAFSPDGKRIATGGEENSIKIWDVQTGTLVIKLTGHRGDVYALAFSPDDEGRWIASGSEDSTVKVWDSRSGDLVHSFRGHTGVVTSVAFGPGGAWLVSGSRDHTAKVWDLNFLNRAASGAGGI